MPTQGERVVVLLRGVNVGGKGKLPMSTLRQICDDLGCRDVMTYIQSGNVVVTTSLSAAKLRTAVVHAVEDAAGFAPKVMIRTKQDLDKILERNPYLDANERFLHIGFLSKKPTKSAVARLGDIDVSPDEFTLDGSEIFLNYVDGAGHSKKLAKVKFEKLLGVDMTARNLNSVRKLQSMA